MSDARKLLGLLAARHSRDVFVPECKGGPTWNAHHRRLDAWAMRRSYTRPEIWGYEIKTSRGDWLQDQKWQDYLPLCNSLSFVAVPGVIQVEELPPEVGLVVSSKNGTRLYTKRKAMRREIEPPVDLYLYLLISRASFDSRRTDSRRSREEWEEWLAEKQTNRTFGWKLRGRLRAIVEERIWKVDDELKRVQAENVRLQDVKDAAGRLGVDIGRWRPGHEAARQIEKLREAFPPGAIKQAQDARNALDRLLAAVEATPQ